MSVQKDETAADIIIPVYNRYSFTRNLIESIYRHTDVPFHIYLVDNASTDETADLHKIYRSCIIRITAAGAVEQIRELNSAITRMLFS